jgi:hypothetical protein
MSRQTQTQKTMPPQPPPQTPQNEKAKLIHANGKKKLTDQQRRSVLKALFSDAKEDLLALIDQALLPSWKPRGATENIFLVACFRTIVSTKSFEVVQLVIRNAYRHQCLAECPVGKIKEQWDNNKHCASRQLQKVSQYCARKKHIQMQKTKSTVRTCQGKRKQRGPKPQKPQPVKRLSTLKPRAQHAIHAPKALYLDPCQLTAATWLCNLSRGVKTPSRQAVHYPAQPIQPFQPIQPIQPFQNVMYGGCFQPYSTTPPRQPWHTWQYQPVVQLPVQQPQQRSPYWFLKQ